MNGNVLFEIKDLQKKFGSLTVFDGLRETICKGDVVGDVSEQDMRRVQIRETILSHLEKEAQNFRLGVKTLSLFFIDEVARTPTAAATMCR